MLSHSFNTPPSWVSHPQSLQNVINDHFSSPQDSTPFINITPITSFHSGFRQAVYWRRRLLPSVSPNTVIFSFLGPQGLVRPNPAQVCEALNSVCIMQNVVEIYKSPNSNFFGITFNNPSDASKVRSAFTYYKNTIVFHVSPSSPHTHQFKILWLPPLFKIHRVHHLLAKYSSTHTLKHETLKINNYSQMPTNVLRGSLELLPDVMLSSLPHLVPLPPPHLGCALLIVDGRPSLCLKCNQEGHLRKACPTHRCSSCKLYHSSTTPCLTNHQSDAIDSPNLWLMDTSDDDTYSDGYTTFSTTDCTHVTPTFSTTDCTHVTLPPLVTYAPTTTEKSLPSSNLLQPKCDRTSLISPGLQSPDTAKSIILSPTQQSPQPAASNTPLITKRFTRSMSSLQCTNHPSLHFSRISSSHLDISSGSFHVLSDEADSSDYDSDVSMNSHSHSSICNSNTSLSDHGSHSHPHSQPPLEITNPNSDHDSISSNTSPSCKRSKLSKSLNSSTIITQDDSILTSHSSKWADQAEDKLPNDIITPPPHDNLTPASTNDSQSTLSSTSMDAPSPYHIYAIPGLIVSFCHMLCLKCQTSSKLKWPLRQHQICSSCNTTLSTPFMKRHFPLPDKVSIHLALSPNDIEDPSSISYLSQILDTNIIIKPLEPSMRKKKS